MITRLPGAHRRALIVGVVQSPPIFLTSFLLTISILLIFLSFTFFLNIVSILSFGPQSLGHFYPTVLLIFQVSFFLIFMVYIYLFNGKQGCHDSCGGQRTTCRNRFSPTKRTSGIEHGCQAWQQLPFLAEPPCQPQVCFKCDFSKRSLLTSCFKLSHSYYFIP